MRTLRGLRNGPILNIVSLVLVFATLAIVGFMIVQQANAIERVRAQYDALHQEYEGLYTEAVTEGVNPEAPAPEDVPDVDPGAPQVTLPQPGPSGAAGARGPGPTRAQVITALADFCSVSDCTPVPTVSQVAAAISDYCSDGGCRGADGDDSEVPGPIGATGAQGPPPTAEQIAAAVEDYCAGGACRGDTGPPPSDEQVRDQVAAYCAENNECQGSTGDTGPQGTAKPGTYACPDGEHVTGFTVAADGMVTLTCAALAGPPIIDPSPLE